MERSKLRYLALFLILLIDMYFLFTPVLAHVPTFEKGDVTCPI
ncbi:MAG: hypothetical protein QG610_2494, partial [Euryarchaeota archaeon]|nr:hypothetical protein [Euryarchaeota archaeon]